MNVLRLVAAWGRRFGQIIVANEKRLLAALSVIIVLSGTFWYREYLATATNGPAAGGTYVEGIVGTKDDIQPIAVKLTKTGLFALDANGVLQNRLVSDWQVSQDKTEYDFTLINGVDKPTIETTLQDNLDLVAPAAVTEGDNGRIVVTMSQPTPNLPLLLTQPLFDYGPYKLSKTTDKTAVFIRNTDANAQSAYINKIIIQIFPDQGSLNTALADRRIDGAVTDAQAPKNGSLQTINFQRYYAVVLNLNKVPFRDAATRTATLNGAPTKDFTLTVPDQEPYLSLANDLVNQWHSQTNVTVTLNKQPLADIENKTAPTRDFEAIILGIDYGAEVDPYYIWQSSQIRPPGNNIAGVKSDTIDTIIGKIESTYNINERLSLIDQLHQELLSEGAGKILKQETVNFAISNNVHFQPPWLPTEAIDHWQMIGQWWIN